MSRCKEILILVCCLFAAVGGGFLTAPSSLAATYYVSTTGNDANPGTLAAPFRTVLTGVLALRAGDTLQIRGGTYPEALIGNIPPGLSWAAPVTVSAYPGEQVILRPNSGVSRVIEFDGEGDAYIIIKGLILDGANVGYDVLKIGGDPGKGIAHHIRIQDTEIKNSPGPGIVVDGTLYSGFSSTPGCCNEFINNHVHHNGTTVNNQGFYVRSGYNLFELNDVHDNKCSGIDAFVSGGSQPNNNIIRRNKVYSNGLTNTKGGGILIGGLNGIVENNLVFGNRDYGIYVFGPNQRDHKVQNNTAYNNTMYGIWIDPASVNTLVANNILYQNGITAVNDQGVGTIQMNNLTVNPLFINPTLNDFRLQSNSPAINRGITIQGLFVDIAGNQRGMDPYDIGAYEFQSSTDTTPPSPPRILSIL